MATYSGGLAENSWNDWDQELRLSRRDPLGGNRTWLNKDVTTSSMVGSDNDLYKSLGLDSSAEMLKNPYAQGLSPEQVVGGVTPEKGLFGQASDWFGNKGNQAMIGAGLGLGQLGLGLASYLQQSDFMKKQGKLLDQQLASNQYEMDRRQGFSRDIRDPNGAFATSYNAVRNA